MRRSNEDISTGNPSEASGGTEAPRCQGLQGFLLPIHSEWLKTNITVFISGSLGCSNGGCTLGDLNIVVTN